MGSEGLKYLEERFGIEKLEGYRLEKKSGDLWLVSDQVDTELEVETWGVRLLRNKERGFKPTSYALQFLGDKISRNIIEVDRSELLMLLKREGMIDRDLDEDGYVALKFEGRVIGCGFYRDDVVSSRVPKGRSNELVKILEGQ